MNDAISDDTAILAFEAARRLLGRATVPDAMRANAGIAAIRARAIQLRRIWLGKLKEGNIDLKQCPFGNQETIDAAVILSELPNPWMDSTTLELWREVIAVLERLAKFAESRNVDCTLLINPPMRSDSEIDSLVLLLDRLEVIEGIEPPTPTVSVSPELVAQLKAVAAGLPTVLEENRAGFERVAGVIESLSARDDDDTSRRKLPTMKSWAMEAWKLNQYGKTLTEIAKTLAKKYNDPKITQPRVSEQIQRAKLNAEASGLASDAAKALPQVGSRAPARTLDPSAADDGQRTDGRSRHLREKARQIAKEE